jgi:hypothetical protein
MISAETFSSHYAILTCYAISKVYSTQDPKLTTVLDIAQMQVSLSTEIATYILPKCTVSFITDTATYILHMCTVLPIFTISLHNP